MADWGSPRISIEKVFEAVALCFVRISRSRHVQAHANPPMIFQYPTSNTTILDLMQIRFPAEVAHCLLGAKSSVFSRCHQLIWM